MASRQSDSSAWAQALTRWKADPISFIAEVLREPRSGKPYKLFPEQERFIREAFTLTPEGRLPYDTAVYATPKKNGKSTTGAMLAIYGRSYWAGGLRPVVEALISPNHAHGMERNSEKASIFNGLIDAEGGTRTRTGVTSQRILSPLCLPFHHPGFRFRPSSSLRLPKYFSKYRELCVISAAWLPHGAHPY